MSPMKRYFVAAIAIAVLLASALMIPFLNRPSEIDYRLARGRAQLDAEDYLAVLETLRGSEAHAYLGAAYLRLHLYGAAIKEFEEAVKLRPKEADPWIGLASTHIELGDSSKAVEEANRAAQIEKQSTDAWISLGRAHWQERNFAETEKAALKARELDAQNPAISELLLHTYFDQNQADKFQAELDRNPKPSPAIRDLAVRFFVRQGQFARAYDFKTRSESSGLNREIFETELALKREPARTELYPQLIRKLVRVGQFSEAINFAGQYHVPVALDLELGKSYWMTGRQDDAIQAYRRASAALVHKLPAEIALAAITGDAKHWQEAFRAERPEQDYFVLARIDDLLPKASPIVRAFIYRYAGIFDSYFYNKAAEESLRILDTEPRNYDALMTIATAYQRLARLDDARRYVERAREAFPNAAEPLSRLANIELAGQAKNPQKVVEMMDQVVKLEPGNAGNLYNLGWIYDQLGDTAKATDFYRRSIQASPLSFEAMNNLALIYGGSGQPDRALPLLQQAIRTDPESEAAYFNIANYYVHRRDWRQSLENYDRIVQLNPANAVAWVEKGRVYLELGRTEDAVEDLNRALEIDAHSFDAYVLLSSAYEKMGHVKEAIAAAEEGARIRSNAPEVSAALKRLKARQDSKK